MHLPTLRATASRGGAAALLAVTLALAMPQPAPAASVLAAAINRSATNRVRVLIPVPFHSILSIPSPVEKLIPTAYNQFRPLDAPSRPVI